MNRLIGFNYGRQSTSQQHRTHLILINLIKYLNNHHMVVLNSLEDKNNCKEKKIY